MCPKPALHSARARPSGMGNARGREEVPGCVSQSLSGEETGRPQLAAQEQVLQHRYVHDALRR